MIRQGSHDRSGRGAREYLNVLKVCLKLLASSAIGRLVLNFKHYSLARHYTVMSTRSAEPVPLDPAQQRVVELFDVLAPNLGFTRSHTIAVRVANEGGGEEVSRRLSQAGIITNKNLLPGDKSPKHPQGIRLGTPELTRVGMKEKEMVAVAELLDGLLHKGRDPDAIAREVVALKDGFTTLQYCFGAGEAAYRYYDLVGRDPS